MRKFFLLLGCLLVLGIIIGFYSFKIEPFRLQVKEVPLANKQTITSDSTELKIVQISDLHLAQNFSVDQLTKIVTKVNQQQPDIVVFTGDLFDNYARYGVGLEDEIINELAKIQATIGKFAVKGNHDYGGGAAWIFEEILTAADFTVFENTGETLTLNNNQQLFIGGLDDALLGDSQPATLLSARANADFLILLTHEPDMAEELSSDSPTLILAGHSHGGQIWLPFYRVKNQLAKEYSKGRYQLNETTELYVSSGIGTTAIHARFLVPPEIAVFTLNV